MDVDSRAQSGHEFIAGAHHHQPGYLPRQTRHPQPAVPGRVHAGIPGGGDTIEDLLAEFPDLERDDLLACLQFAAESLKLKTQHLALA